MTNKEKKIMKANEAIEYFEQAAEKILEAIDLLISAKNAHLESGLDVGYCLSGNLDAYVINHLGASNDSIESKIMDYVQEISVALDDIE